MKKEDAVTIDVYSNVLMKLTVGHVTLSTYPRYKDGILVEGIFVDFRPKGHEEGKAVWGGAVGKRTPSGVPDVRVHLYGLDIDAIEGIWGKIQSRVEWGLLSKFKDDTTSRAIRHNSVSLCLFLLYFGGIRQSHKITPSGSIQWFFEWCEAGLRAVLKGSIAAASVAVAATTAAAAVTTLVENSAPLEKKAEAALLLFSEQKNSLNAVNASVNASVSQTGIFVEKTVQPFSVTPGEMETILLQCKKHQEDVLKIKKDEGNKFEDILPPPSSTCLIL